MLGGFCIILVTVQLCKNITNQFWYGRVMYDFDKNNWICNNKILIL